MGQFSWIDANGKQNIAEKDTVTLLIPQEYIKTAGKFFGVDTVEHGIRGEYDGYGSVVVNNRTVGVEQLYSFLNLCCTSKEQMSDLAERYRYVMSGTGISRAGAGWELLPASRKQENYIWMERQIPLKKWKRF